MLRLQSIRANLFVLVAACVLPTLIAATGILAFYYQHERSRLFDQTLPIARALQNSVDRELAAVQSVLELLATSPYLQGPNPDLAAFHGQAAKALARSGINNIALFTQDEMVLNTAVNFGKALPRGPGPWDDMIIFSTGKAEVSGLIQGVLVKRFLLTVAVPVLSGDALKYGLVGVLLTDRLQTIITNASLPEDWLAVVYDKSAIIAARSRTPELFLGKSVSSGLVARLKLANEGTQSLTASDGTDVFSAFSRSASTGWGVAIGIPRDSLTSDLRRSLWLLGTATCFLLAVGLTLARLQGGRIAASVRALIPVGTKLARGEPVLLPTLPIREVDEVATAITNASRVLVQAQQALSASEARMRGILESAMDAIITVDANDCIVLYNAAAHQIFGWTHDEVMGKPLDMLLSERVPDNQAAPVAGRAAVDTTSRIMGGTSLVYGRRASGEEFPIEVSVSRIKTNNHEMFSVILRDVTTRELTNEALKRSNLDLQQFAFIASHDLKTPLRSISGYVHLLQKNYADKLDEKGLAMLRRTTASVNMMEQLTEDLLSYARVNSEVKPFTLVHCSEMINDVIELMNATLISRGARVTYGELPQILGDRTQLVQLFLNLIGNGVKYCGGREPVMHISAHRSNGEWKFSITDNGIGIDAKDLEKVFDVFTRLHSQQTYSGTGIGLAVCRRVVERHGGKIWATSVLGEGSTFYLTIPDRFF